MGKNVISDESKVVVKSLVDIGLTYRAIKEIIPISIGYITKVCKEFDENKELIEFYRINRADILLKAQMDNMALQEAIRDSITPTDLEGWKPDERARWFSALGVDFGIKFDKERLELDKSTENVDFHLNIAAIKGHTPTGKGKVTQDKG